MSNKYPFWFESASGQREDVRIEINGYLRFVQSAMKGALGAAERRKMESLKKAFIAALSALEKIEIEEKRRRGDLDEAL